MLPIITVIEKGKTKIGSLMGRLDIEVLPRLGRIDMERIRNIPDIQAE